MQQRPVLATQEFHRMMSIFSDMLDHGQKLERCVCMFGPGHTTERLDPLDGFIVHLVRRGRVALTMGDQTWQASAGDCLLVLPTTKFHEVSLLDDGTQEPSAEVWTFPYLVNQTTRFFVALAPVLHIPIDAGGLGELTVCRPIIALVEGQHLTSDSSPAVKNAYIRAILLAALEVAVRDVDLRTLWAGSVIERRISEILVDMSRGYAEAFLLEDLAKRYGCSRSFFLKTFQQMVGRTPREYVQDLRMRVASRKLALNDDPMARIAGEVGYADEFSFSRAFKRHFGVSPERFRKEGGAATN